MSFSLFVLDGLVVLIFFVALAGAYTDEKFRLTPFRFLRSFAIPCCLIWLIHNPIAQVWFVQVFEFLPKRPDVWWQEILLMLAVIVVGMCFMAILPFIVIGLVVLITAQLVGWGALTGKQKI